MSNAPGLPLTNETTETIIQSLSTPVIFGLIVITLLVAGSLLFLGRQIAQDQRRFFGTARLRRMLIEILLLNLFPLFISLYMLTNVELLSWLIPVFNLLFLPLWAAMRLDVPRATMVSEYVDAYNRAVVGLALTVFGTSAFDYMVLLQLLPLDVIITTTLAVVILFIFIRGMIDVVRFTLWRDCRPQMQFLNQDSITKLYPYLECVIYIALILWAISYILYFNRSSYPEWVYIHPRYSNPLLPSNLLLPINRSFSLMVATSISPLFILFIGLFVVRRRIPEQASFLFGVLCLLYGLWGLEIFPSLGGPIFLSVHLLAWLFIPPVLLHFALVFPHKEETITDNVRSLWAWVQLFLYSSFVLMIPIWLYIFLHTPQEIKIYIQPLLWLGILGLLSLPSAYIIGVYILKHTSRCLSEAYKKIKFKPSGCLWKDLVEGRQISRITLAEKQLRGVTYGLRLAGIIFVSWFLFLPWIITYLGGWGDVLIRFGVAMLFIFILYVMSEYSLWGTGRIVVLAFVWALLVIINPAASEWLVSKLESILAPIIGFFVFIILALFKNILQPLLKKLTHLIYCWFWPEKFFWHDKLKKIGNRLRDNRPFSLNQTLGYLVEACPEKASAAWLLVPTNNLDDPIYSIHDICHSSDCHGVCNGLLAEYLGATNIPNYLCLPTDLNQSLNQSIAGDEIQVLVVERLMERANLLSLIFHQQRADLSIDETTWGRLCKARIALLVPLGGGNTLWGIYVIATDGRGDYYDQNDIDSLSKFAHDMSIAIA